MPTFRVFEVDAIPTTEDLLNEFMVNVVCTANGITDIAVGSKLWTIGYALARQHASIYYTLYFYRKQSFVLTATGKYLDLHGLEVGVIRHKANPAGGEATFYRLSPAPMDILIPKGTLITTPIVSSEIQPIKFRTTVDVIMAMGTTSATATIVCTQPGVAGNLPSGAITRIETVLSGAQAVSTTSTSGGLEIETDDNYRLRIMTAWAARETGTSAAIRNAVLSVQGIRNAIIVDPARYRSKQDFVINAATSGQQQVLLETTGYLAAKYDIWLTLEYNDTTALTLTIEQIDNVGNIVAKETVPFISSGWDLINKINSWTQSATLRLNSLVLENEIYKGATDNEVVEIISLAPETRDEKIFVHIQDKPSGVGKRIVVSTYAQYRHNEILGQTEVSPLAEVFDDIGTYEHMVSRINEQSRLINMRLLDEKIVTELKTPTPYEGNTNSITLDYVPVLEILEPQNENISIIDSGQDSQSEHALIAVGTIAAPFNITYKYRANIIRVAEDGGKTRVAFGEKTPENIITALSPDGSDLLVASVITTPGEVNDVEYAYCSEAPRPFPRTLMRSYYELVRGKVDVTVIPYTLTEQPREDLLEQVVAKIERVRPAGVEVNVIWPTAVFIDAEVTVEVVAGTTNTPADFYDTIRANITDYINSLEMGEPAYRDKIIAAANPNIAGLKVARVLKPVADIPVAKSAFLRAGNIIFTN